MRVFGGDPSFRLVVVSLEVKRMGSTKSWFQSKTIWSGAVAVGVAAWNAASQEFGVPPIPDYVFGILGALGIYGRASASSRIRGLTK